MLKRTSKSLGLIVAIFILVVTLGACGKEDVEFQRTELDNLTWFETNNVDTLPIFESVEKRDSYWVYQYSDFVTENGRFRFPEEKRVLEFCDWKTDEVYPLCIKTNCMHENDSCNAYFEYKTGGPKYLYYDGNYLYYGYSGGRAATEWYRQKVDGSDRIKLFSVDEGLAGNRVIYREEMLYFLTLDYEGSEITEGQAGKFKYHVYSANLKTGDVVPLTCEFSEDIKGRLVTVELMGIYQNQLIINYEVRLSSETMDSRKIMLMYNISDGMMEGVASWDSSLNLVTCPNAIEDGIYVVLELDLKTEKHINDHVYYEGRLNVFDLKKGKRYVLDNQEGVDYNLSYVDGKLFCSKVDKQNVIVETYDIETGEKTTIPEETAELIIDGEVKEWLYGRVLSEEDTFISFHILKTDYYNGERNLCWEDSRLGYDRK